MKKKFACLPTMYNGVQYRSRLEARWACFFDLLKWSHEYEEEDLPGWTPDFYLTHEGSPLLLEVKPYRWPNDDEIHTMMAATRGYGLPREGALSLAGLQPKHWWIITEDGAAWPVLTEELADKMMPAWKHAGNVVQWKAA